MSKSKKQPKLKDLINESFENFNGIATLKPVNSPVRKREVEHIKETSNEINEQDVKLTDLLKIIKLCQQGIKALKSPSTQGKSIAIDNFKKIMDTLEGR